jgi:PAS domain S-box-containing protein
VNYQITGRILVVDDEELIRSTLSIMLSQDGYNVLTADSGEQALQILERESLDVIVSDLKMGRMDGIAVLKKAKEMQPDVDVIILTGCGSIESAIDALRYDAYDYLLKPVNDDKLRIVINRCFEKKRLVSAVRAAENHIRFLKCFYESLLSHLDEAIVVLDSDLRVVDYNRVATRWGKDVLGCESSLEKGMEFADLAPRFRERQLEKSYHDVIETGVPFQFEDCVGDSGVKRWVLVRALSMPGNDAGDRQVLTVITDITEMKLLELEALRGKKLEGITQAAVTLNHEINNPLGVILGNANLLMTDCPDENAEQHEKLNIIFQQTKRISEITQKLAKITQPYEAQYLDDKMMIDVNRST